jgi:hypothetical protein
MSADVKKDLYTDIVTALEGIVDSDNVRKIEHVLKYNSQDFNNDSIDQKNYPQAWMQFSSVTWLPSELKAHNENATQEQKGNVEITVFISQYSLDNDDSTWQSNLSLINDIYRALTNMGGDGYSPLQRVSEVDDIDNNNVRTWQIVFSTAVTECGVDEGLEDASPVELTIIKAI